VSGVYAWTLALVAVACAAGVHALLLALCGGARRGTLVLASVPQSGGRAAAVREARKALDAGLSDVGVINSSEYSSLHSGYFVVFSGIYSSQSEARSNLSSARGTYPQAYARQIVQ